MHRSLAMAGLSLGLLIASSLVPAAASVGAVTTRISVGPSGEQANGNSGAGMISANGRYVSFASWASNLVPGDTNERQDVFVRDLVFGTTSRVSVSSTGIQANNVSNASSISSDGRFVAFASPATNLVPNDNNEGDGPFLVFDVFVHDRLTAETTRASVSSSGVESNGTSLVPSISGDGRYVVFQSSGSNLVSGDTNASEDVFVFDRVTSQTERVSVGQGEIEANGASRPLTRAISADGRFVAFSSLASNLVPSDSNGTEDVFVYDRFSAVTSRVSVSSNGTGGNAPSILGSISDDGLHVVFSSHASNLIPDDANGLEDVFIHNRLDQTTARVSVSTAGSEANGESHFFPDVSANGRYAVFTSEASNLVPADNNLVMDVFLHDNVTGDTILLSSSSSGVLGDRPSCCWPSISGDGRLVAYDSQARNLVPGDTNESNDMFLSDYTGTGLRVIDKYVAMGDSYSAGEGLLFYYPDSDTDLNKCHRFIGAYPHRVVAPPSPSPLAAREASGEPNVSFDFIACSGAETINVWSGGNPQYNEPGTQVDQGVLTPETDLVTITIGGNDASFSQVLIQCFFYACLDPAFQPFDGMPFSEWVPAHIDSIDWSVRKVLTDITARAPNATVLMLGYPRIFPDTAEEQDCLWLVPWRQEQVFLNDMADRLNGVISTAAQQADAIFVDVSEHFSNHEVCGAGGAWINGPEELDVTFKPPFFRPADGAFHPNDQGQVEYAAPVNTYLNPQTMTSSHELLEAPALKSEELTQVESQSLLGTLGRLRATIGKRASGCTAGSPLAPGDSVVVEGKNFGRRTSVTVRFVTPQGNSTLLQKQSGTNGDFSGKVTLPSIQDDSLIHGLEASGPGANGGRRILSNWFRMKSSCQPPS